MSGLLAISTASPEVIREVLLALCQDPGNREHALAIIRVIENRNGNLQQDNILSSTNSFAFGGGDMDRNGLYGFINEPINIGDNETQVDSQIEQFSVLPIGFIPQIEDGPLPDDPLERVLLYSFDHTAYRTDGLPPLSNDPVEAFLHDMPNFPSSNSVPFDDSFNRGTFEDYTPPEQVDDVEYSYFPPQSSSTVFDEENSVEITLSIADGASSMDWDNSQRAQTHMADLIADMRTVPSSHSLR